MSDTNDISDFLDLLDSEECINSGTKILYCPAKLFSSLKKLSVTKSTNVYLNSHKCVFVYNNNTHLTEIEIIPNSYSYQLIRNIQNSTTKEPQSIDVFAKETNMNLLTECLESMFCLGIVSTNRDIGVLIRGFRRLAKTLDIKHSKEKDYIYQCFSQIIRILENINL